MALENDGLASSGRAETAVESVRQAEVPWESESLRRDLHQLIDDAEQSGKVIHTFYQDLSFTPQEFRKAICNGRFRWGLCNWNLKEPLLVGRTTPPEAAAPTEAKP